MKYQELIEKQAAKDNALLDKIGSEVPHFKERFISEHHDCYWRNLKIVKKPDGDEQTSDYWVDQYQDGEDSFSGYTYSRIDSSRWLRATFEM